MCNFSVRPRQEGLQCEGCYRWQHRTCDTGISRAQYRAAVQSGVWQAVCSKIQTLQYMFNPLNNGFIETYKNAFNPMANKIFGSIQSLNFHDSIQYLEC